MDDDASRPGDRSTAGAASGAKVSEANPSVSDRSPDAESSSPRPAHSRPDRDDVSQDDRDVGWGDRPGPSDRDDEWFRRERPPHHG